MNFWNNNLKNPEQTVTRLPWSPPYGTLSRCAGTSILQVELVLVQLPGSEPSNDAWTVSKPRGPFRRINYMNWKRPWHRSAMMEGVFLWLWVEARYSLGVSEWLAAFDLKNMNDVNMTTLLNASGHQSRFYVYFTLSSIYEYMWNFIVVTGFFLLQVWRLVAWEGLQLLLRMSRSFFAEALIETMQAQNTVQPVDKARPMCVKTVEMQLVTELLLFNEQCFSRYAKCSPISSWKHTS